MMSDRIFRDRQLPLDGGIEVVITADGTPEDEVFIEYRSDALVIYTGERARAAREGGTTAAPASRAVGRVAPPDRRPRPVAVPSPSDDPDYVPPSVAEQVVAEQKARREQEAYDRVETVTGEDDILEPEPARPTSRTPKSPIDRTRAQRNALNINTTMQTSMGETRVTADLSGMLKRG